MQVFDAHVHIESSRTPYDISVSGRNLICNHWEEWETYKAAKQPEDTLSLIFDYRQHFDEIYQAVVRKEVQALKIHSRLQGICAGDYQVLADSLAKIPVHIPIILDAFYYGPEIEYQPSLSGFAALIRTFSDRIFIIAHSGGHEVLRYFLHLRPCKNTYFEVSLSLAYLHKTSAYQDLKIMIDRMPPERILFGSDYPTVAPAKQLSLMLEIFEEFRFSEQARDQILFENAKRLFQSA